MTNIYETSKCVLDSYDMAARYMTWEGKKINDSRREMTEGTNLGKRNKRCRYKKHIIELRAVEVRHFLKKWNLKCNKDKFVATTDIM